MQITTVLFDLDGTIVDSLSLVLKAYQQVYKKLKIPWGKKEAKQWTSLPLKTIARRYGKQLEKEFWRLFSYYYVRDHNSYIKLFPGTEKAFQQLLQDKKKLGLVTSKTKRGTERTLKFLKLENYFQSVITADDVLEHKPNASPLLKALKELKAHPQEAVYIGDSPSDIEAGHNAGIKAIGVTWGMSKRQELLKLAPVTVINSWEELFPLINKHRSEKI